jgi:hypothetical protein
VILIDSLLVGGLRFVFDKLAQAVDAELHDDTLLREELLAAQMRLELGEITDEEFAETEADLLRRIREARARGAAGPAAGPLKLASVEATFAGDEHEQAPSARPSRRRRG